MKREKSVIPVCKQYLAYGENYSKKSFVPTLRFDLDTQIYDDGICIVDGQFRYSPDGLSVVSLTTKGVTSRKTTLFEFKCLFSRTPDGSIPNIICHRLNGHKRNHRPWNICRIPKM